MPRLTQMFPSRFLQPEDLQPNTITIVTIEKVDAFEAKRQSFDDDAETLWAIKFREFRKPAKLKAVLARTIADVLGTDQTELWAGQRVGIYPVQIVAYGKPMLVINCDIRRPEPVGPALPGTTTVGAAGNRILPRSAVDRFLAALAERGANWDDFVRWLRVYDAAAYEQVHGRDLDNVPHSVTQLMAHYRKAILSGLTPADILAGRTTLGGEVIDRNTGEVVGQAPTAPPASPARPVGSAPAAVPSRSPAQEVGEEDIPF